MIKIKVDFGIYNKNLDFYKLEIYKRKVDFLKGLIDCLKYNGFYELGMKYRCWN